MQIVIKKRVRKHRAQPEANRTMFLRRRLVHLKHQLREKLLLFLQNSMSRNLRLKVELQVHHR